MNNTEKVSRMILIKGLAPDLDLGIEWDEDSSDAVMLCTAINDSVVLLGNMLLTADNMMKLKNFNWKYLVKLFDGKWELEDLDWGLIPRPSIDKTELIKIQLKEGDEDEEGIIF